MSTAALELELRSLGLKDLRKRAKAEGMSASELEEAMDADDPEEVFIGFLLQKQKQKESDCAEVMSTAALELELRSLGLKDLRKRAKAGGMSASEREEAMDADDPEEVFIGFLLQKQKQKESDCAEVMSTAALELELRSLGLKDLRKRAKAEGMSASE
eukprot:SAG31_NODE_7_length_42755_cov_130.245728_44_plen_157_part_01